MLLNPYNFKRPEPTSSPFTLDPNLYGTRGGSTDRSQGQPGEVWSSEMGRWITPKNAAMGGITNTGYNGGSMGVDPSQSLSRIGNKGGVMAPPSPNALEANGRAGMGSLDNFYASRTRDPNTGLALNPSSMDIFNNRAQLQGFGGQGKYLGRDQSGNMQWSGGNNQSDFEKLGATDAYYKGRNTNNPYLTMYAGRRLQDINSRRQPQPGASSMGTAQNAAVRAMEAMKKIGGFGIPGMAKGGPTKPINPYLVGEEGPEIFQPDSGAPELIGAHGPEIRTFPQHGRIIPNDKIAKLKPMKDGGEADASRDFFGHTPEEDAAITATAKRRPSYFNPLNWFSAENNPPSVPQKRGFVSSSWITPEATQNLKERMQNVDYMPHPGEAIKELNAAVNPMASPYNGVASLVDMISPRSSGSVAPQNMSSAIFAPSASLIPSRVRGEDDILRSDPSRMPSPYQFPADNAAALSTLGHINRYTNPYAGMSNDMRFMHAMDDARNGIIQRGDDGSAKFASGGGTIFNRATGQMEAYGPNVVRHDSVAFTPGHVKDDKGDLTRFNPKAQSTEKPAAPPPAKKLTQAELVAQYNRTHKEDPELTAKKKAIDEETAVLQSMTRPAAERIAQHYANKSSNMSGRQLENVIGLPHVGDPGTMTGVPMAPKGYPLPKLTNPFLAGDPFADVRPGPTNSNLLAELEPTLNPQPLFGEGTNVGGVYNKDPRTALPNFRQLMTQRPYNPYLARQ